MSCVESQAALCCCLQRRCQFFLVKQRAARALRRIHHQVSSSGVVHLAIPEAIVIKPLRSHLAFVCEWIDVIGHEFLGIRVVLIGILPRLLSERS